MDLKELQAYAYFFYTAFLVFILYVYIFYIYRSEKKGLKNFEQYGNIALSDEIDSKPIEAIESAKSEHKTEAKDSTAKKS